MGMNFADIKQFGCTTAATGINLLIGADQMWAIMTGETYRSENDRFVGINIIFGWTFQGSSRMSPAALTSNCMVCVLHTHASYNEDDISTDDAVKKFWELESMGIAGEGMNNKGTTQILADFESSISRKGIRYDVAVYRGSLMPDFYKTTEMKP